METMGKEMPTEERKVRDALAGNPEIPLVNSEAMALLAQELKVEPDQLAEEMVRSSGSTNGQMMHNNGHRRTYALLRMSMERVRGKKNAEELKSSLKGLAKGISSEIKAGDDGNARLWHDHTPVKVMEEEGKLVGNLMATVVLEMRNPSGRYEDDYGKSEKKLEIALAKLSQIKLWYRICGDLGLGKKYEEENFYQQGERGRKSFVVPEELEDQYKECQQEALGTMKEAMEIVMLNQRDGNPALEKYSKKRLDEGTISAFAGKIENWFGSKGMKIEGQLKGVPPARFFDTQADLRNKIVNIQEQLAKLQQEKEGLKTDLKTAQEDAVDKGGEITSLQNTLETLKTSSLDKGTVVRALQNLIDNAETTGLFKKTESIPIAQIQALMAKLQNPGNQE